MGDWTSATYIISQIFVIIAYCGFSFTYLIKRRVTMLGVVIASNTMMVLGFVLLSAWVGVGTGIVAICRDVVSLFMNAKRKPEDRGKTTKLDRGLIVLWITAALIITLFAHQGFLTWFAFFATAVFMISIWQKNVFVYRLLGVLVGVFWITYNVVVDSLFGVILESALSVFVIVGVVMYCRQILTKRRNGKAA